MATVNDKKMEVCEKLTSAAADLIVTRGIENISMKEVAKEAGVSDVLMYKYFPNKERFVTGFYQTRAELALQTYQNTDGLDEYTPLERIQLLVDTFLERMAADREFVAMTFDKVIFSKVTLKSDQLPFKKQYTHEFLQIIEDAIEKDHYPDAPMLHEQAKVLTQYLLFVVMYWLKDESDSYVNTTRMTDLSINLIDKLLQSGAANTVIEMKSFLLKTHLGPILERGEGVMRMFRSMSSMMGNAY